jgi:hypothetical protein
MKYQDKLNELGMTAEKTSASIQKSIATLDDIIDTYHNAKKMLENTDDEEEEEDINKDIEQMEGDIAELDERIVEKLEDYDKNKEMYAERAKKMQEGRKANSSVNAPSQPQQQTQPQFQPQPKVEVLEQPKKKSNWALWLVGGIVAVITLNQVVIGADD